MAEADGAFVPEEEVEGPSTQGDGLMAAKAKRKSMLASQPDSTTPVASSDAATKPQTSGKS